ncbi:glutaminyl-tRNA synthase (glutamine-hydrolyzing) subunit B [Candidatus Giovannonibacteria bacterium RIFCSPLOWO2_01_FULL_44_16]|nr:MAG: glutaminyl-tRNA synthase (glutamine-hydrolyzing) subunit B [Candidatus Giovannonibacteria bacterium RIFCSPLOWO2_01_FULL_44_16]
MQEYGITIGMEVHAELRTKTKMFCSCKNDPDEKHPNINICPVCMGHPGTLPVANESAIKHVQSVGLAIKGEPQKTSQFDRKNYFYPDIPKGYQISQYQHPLVLGGSLNGVKITRVHLEEDTARSQHDNKNKSSYVDYNRAGVPLMELVTEPDITSAKQAKDFVEELQLLLQYLGASEANMEKGEMRCEANISVYSGVERLSGTKVEVKNLNSFRAVEKAIEYEIKRQIGLLEKGEKVKQETRGWDENKQSTFSQRSKESAHDYRYFPEPDLPPMEFSEEYFDELRATIPELPKAKRKRLLEEYKLESVAADILIRDQALAAFWEKMASELREWVDSLETQQDFSRLTLSAGAPTRIQNLAEFRSNTYFEAAKLAVNYFISDLVGLIKEKQIPTGELLVDPENFAELIKMIYKKEITSRVAKDVLRHMVEQGGDPSTIVEEKGLKQMSDTGALEEIAKKIISANPNAIADYKKGKQQSLQFLVGQMMKETKGAANPETILEILTRIIGGV